MATSDFTSEMTDLITHSPLYHILSSPLITKGSSSLIQPRDLRGETARDRRRMLGRG